MLDEVVAAKSAVIRAALGICALSESELLERLERLYWEGFQAGDAGKGLLAVIELQKLAIEKLKRQGPAPVQEQLPLH